MARIESQHTRQALLEVGTTMETSPPPERLQLFYADGQPFDAGKDATRARWRGTWVADPLPAYETNDFVLNNNNLWILADESLNVGDETTAPSDSETGAWVLMTVGGGMKWKGAFDTVVEYDEGDVVTHENGLWVAPGPIPDHAAVPGVDSGLNPYIGTDRGVDFYASDRFASTDPVRVVIGPGPDEQHHGGDLHSMGAIFLLDKTANLPSGVTLHIQPVAGTVSSDGMTFAPNFPGSGGLHVGMFRTWSAAEVLSGTEKTVDLSGMDTDHFCHVYFGSAPSVAGAFDVWVSDDTNLVPPPDPASEWEQMVAAVSPDVMSFRGTWDSDLEYTRSDVVFGSDGALYIARNDIPVNTDPTSPPGVVTASVPYHGSRSGYLAIPEVPILYPPAVEAGSGYNGSPATHIKYEDTPGTEVEFTWDNGNLGYAEDGAGVGLLKVGTFQTFSDSPYRIAVPASGIIALEIRGAGLTQVLMTGGSVENQEGWGLLVPAPATGIPDGGDTGDILTKQSSDDGDADWATPSADLPIVWRGVWDDSLAYPVNSMVFGSDGASYLALTDIEAGVDPTAGPALEAVTVPFHGSRAGYKILTDVPITVPPAVKVSGYNGSPSLFLKYEDTPGTVVTFTWDNDDTIYTEDGSGNPVYKVGTFTAFGPSGTSFAVPASGFIAAELRDLDVDLTTVTVTGGTPGGIAWMPFAPAP